MITDPIITDDLIERDVTVLDSPENNPKQTESAIADIELLSNFVAILTLPIVMEIRVPDLEQIFLTF